MEDMLPEKPNQAVMQTTVSLAISALAGLYLSSHGKAILQHFHPGTGTVASVILLAKWA